MDPRLGPICDAHPYPLLFATVSGAHLYGFASPDSDYDLRGVHVLPAREVLGLGRPRETIEQMRPPASPGDLDLDLVTHDVAKFMRLMLAPNGYVLEQLHSPLVVRTSPAHEELAAIGRRCVTRRHARHYIGFAQNQWRIFSKEHPPRVKPLLYVYRVLLTGAHLMNTGVIEADLRALNAAARLAHVDELIARKTAGREQTVLDAADLAFHEREYVRLFDALGAARDASALPDESDPSVAAALDDLLIRLRLGAR